MTHKEFPKAYESKNVEDAMYQAWLDSQYFNPDNLPGDRSESFTISMPPPNATGTLHLGHAVMLAIQDLVIRHQRMAGKKALWLPGTDHAAMATQEKVERILLDTEKKTKHDLGREAFLNRINKFIADSQSTIRNQICKMGSSCDWSRERYTLDAGLNKAVNRAFVEMYNDGLVYRGDRIVNWDPFLQTTVSDDEVEYKQVAEPFYYFKYGPFTIATSRPETKFGDKYVVMHPDDKRYTQYKHGDTFEAEWINGPVTATVIKDDCIDMELGTGVMTITPWHDATDFDIAERHNLPKEQVINFDGTLMEIAQEFAGMHIKDARKKIVEKLESKGLLEKVDENYTHNVAINSRGGGVIEPQIKRQWFVNVTKPVAKFDGKSIKDRAIEVVRSGQIKIIPERFEKTYFHWLENLRDWCISRQIWFGHRIPAYYKNNEADIYVGDTPPEGEEWKQDPDTLDTWFSSGLWTFSTLGWPEQTTDLKTFHPTSFMETGYDIIFFWVARMIIMSTYLMEDIPFKEVYLHGLVKDEKGRKMSKSLGNIIDPLDMISSYGADATRLSLVIGTTPGNDSNLSEAKVAGYRNFVNKLWNISRYILTSVEEVKLVTQQPAPVTTADAWIISELNELIGYASDNLEKRNFSAVGEKIYEFTWSKLADWYIEVAKVEKNKDEILLYILQTILKLWHPFCPFVTEEIWKNFEAGDFLMIQQWPTAQKLEQDGKTFEQIQVVITAIRNARSEARIAPAHKLDATVITSNTELFEQHKEVLAVLARLQNITVANKADRPAQSLAVVVPGAEIYIPVGDLIDIDAEKTRLQKEQEQLQKYIDVQNKKLSNESFVSNAPAQVVDGEKTKLQEAQDKLTKITDQINNL